MAVVKAWRIYHLSQVVELSSHLATVECKTMVGLSILLSKVIHSNRLLRLIAGVVRIIRGPQQEESQTNSLHHNEQLPAQLATISNSVSIRLLTCKMRRDLSSSTLHSQNIAKFQFLADNGSRERIGVGVVYSSSITRAD